MKVYYIIFHMICMISVSMNNQVLNHIQMIPLSYQSGHKRLSSVGLNIGNPNDPRRTRENYQRAGISLSCTNNFLSVKLCIIIGFDPRSYYPSHHDPIWQAIMDDEYHSLQKNATFELVSCPHGRKIVQCKWVLLVTKMKWYF